MYINKCGCKIMKWLQEMVVELRSDFTKYHVLVCQHDTNCALMLDKFIDLVLKNPSTFLSP